MPPESGGVLFVHAHPDDESVATGGTIARLVDEGVRVDLVTCTDGAEGEVHDPDLDADEARPRLAAIRREELACSVAALGDGAIRHHVLGYRDSGMVGTDANAHPHAFWQADLDEATGRLVEIVRGARPVVIVSYDSNGNYGHPDHINAHRIARAAFDGVNAVDRFYEIAFNREAWFGLMTEMKERGIKLPWDLDAELEGREAEDLNPTNVEAVRQASDELEAGKAPAEFGTPDAQVTTRVDVAAFADRKRRSMECHRTQRQDMGWLLDLPDDLAARAIATEWFVLTSRRSAPVPDGYREGSLLASKRDLARAVGRKQG
ncbi:MAG: PIG-L family deacetylase [Candidatus Limnocylindria bacterium]